MGEVTMGTAAYGKIILHAAKYPHCAVNGVLLADGTKVKSGSKNQDLHIVDSVPLFHHSHNLTPMAEIALTQIEALVQNKHRIIAGYYAASENFRLNDVENCPGQRIAEKIVEYFPSAVFAVLENKHMGLNLENPGLKLHRYNDGKWTMARDNKVIFQSPFVLETISHLLQSSVQRDLVDFDNFLDDTMQDWSNSGIDKLISSIVASQAKDKH